MLYLKERRWSLKGIKFGREVPSIAHLLFVDDLLLFVKATKKESSELEECLNKYMLWSGKKVNKEKFFVHFSNKNFHGQGIIPIINLLEQKMLQSKAKHLRLPLLIPRSRTRAVKEFEGLAL